MPQEEIHRLLLEHARRRARRSCGSRAATRSCSGAAARRRSCAWRPASRSRSCPGVTAGVAAPAYAGIPVTHRELASGVAFVTGHEHPDKPETALDWPALAAFPGTLVFYMGVRALPRIAEQLDGRRAARGRAGRGGRARHAARPAHAARHAGRRGRARGGGADPRRPAITLVGPVAGLREQLAWLERRPLHGRTVAVTRARPQASALAARLRELGAEVVEAPAIRTRALEAALPDVARLRPRLRDVAERRPRAVRAARRGRPRRAGARGPHGRGDRPGHRAGAARARRAGGRGAGARGRRGPGRGARRRRRRARADRARARGPRRAARRAARARRGGRRARALRDGRRAARRAPPPAPRPPRTT